MSALYDTADALVARLKEHLLLADVPVIVDRQKDVLSELRKAIGKQTGCLIVVAWTGSPNFDEASAKLRLASTFSVTGFFKPVINDKQTPADDIMEAVAIHLHDWKMRSDDPFMTRFVVKNITPITPPELLAIRIDLETKTTI